VPELCIHVGVGRKGSFALEQVCRNAPYLQTDAEGRRCGRGGGGGECILDGNPVYRTRVDVGSVIAELHQSHGKSLAVKASEDAGLYLCEFTYYISSSRRESPVVFVHVPPVGHPYTQAEIGGGLQRVVRQIVRECAAHCS